MSVAARLLALVLAVAGPAGAAVAAPTAPSAAPAFSHITGSVTDPDGAGVRGIEVIAYLRSSGSWYDVRSVQTDADGAYDLAVQPGRYRVEFRDYRHFYVGEMWDDVQAFGQATDVLLAEQSTVDSIDAELARTGAEFGALTGTVTGPTGAPLQGIRAAVFRFDPAEVGSEWYPDGWIFWDSSRTSGSGDFWLPLDPGTYRLQFYDVDDYAYVPEWWDDVPSLAEATDLTVAAGATTDGLDAVLHAGATVSGLVTTQFPPSDVQWFDVTLWERTSDGTYESVDYQLSYEDEDTPEYDGVYVFENVAPGTYRVGVDGAENLTGEFWNDKPDLATADDIVVTAGAVVTGKDVHLTVAGPPDDPEPPPPVDPPPATPQEPTPPATSGAVTSTDRPRLTGKAVVGRRLRVTSGGWSPGDVVLTYRWLADGKVIRRANRATYALTGRQLGKRIRVEVTAAATGHQPASARTRATRAVRQERPRTLRSVSGDV